MLNKNISVATGIAIAISMVVGSGLFALPGLAIEATDPLTALSGWLFVILLMPPMIHIFSFLGQKFPYVGGVTLYASHAFGKWSEGGFSLIICGALAVGMPAFFMVGGAYLAELFSLDVDTWFIPLAIILALASTAMNIAGVDKLGWVNKFVVISVLAIVVVIAVSTFFTHDITTIEHSNVLNDFTLNIGGIWLASTIIFWAFQGWENMSFGLEEFEKPERSIPIVFWCSYLFIAVVYLVFALTATLTALSGEDVTGLSGLVSLMGTGYQRQIILVFTVMVLIANANSWVFGASRAFFSAAKQGVMPQQLTRLDKNKQPLVSLLATLVLYILIMLCMWFLDIHARYAFLLTTQGFIILYGASILAFYKLTSGFWARLIALAALGSWSFLMHGFGLLVLYPVVLFIIGVFIKNSDFKVFSLSGVKK